MDCRALTTGILDPERETSLDEVLAALELPVQRFQAELGMGRAAEVIELSVNGVRVTLMPTSSSRVERSPDPRESVIFLELAEEVFDRFRPAVLLTYGDHPSSFKPMRRARRVAGAECPRRAGLGGARGTPVVSLRFHHSHPRCTCETRVKCRRASNPAFGSASSRRAAAQVC